MALNGTFLQAEENIFKADNRSFRYGDGCFESILVHGGRIPLGHYHFKRLFNSLRLLEIRLPATITPEFLTDQIGELCGRNHCQELARVRLTLFREDGGWFLPKTMGGGYLLQAWPLAPSTMNLNPSGWKLGTYTQSFRPADGLSSLKSNNCLLWVMASLFAHKYNWDEALLLNQFDRIADTSRANLFLVLDRKILTPPLSEGCVDGVMRRWILEHSFSLPVVEMPLDLRDLAEASEVFLTNAIQGIRWVGQFEGHSYENKTARELHRVLMDSIGGPNPT